MTRIHLPADDVRPGDAAEKNLHPDKKAQVSYTGLVFAPDGKRLYLSNVNGSVKVFAVGPDGISAAGAWLLPKNAAPERREEIPAGLAVSPDGTRLYVCGSLSNRLHELDTADGKVLRSLETGMLPFDALLLNGHAWVTNRAGRRPMPGDRTETAGKGVNVRVDQERFLPAPGTVSVVELSTGKVVDEIETGRQPGAIAATPDGAHVVVANADSDSLTIIDALTRKVVEERSVRWRADDPFGATPTALCFLPDGKRLLVCLGTQNAVAVFDFDPGHTKLTGMIPTAWFPSGVVHDARRNILHISNLKGVGSGVRTIAMAGKANSLQYYGTLSHVPVPDTEELATMTETVLDNYRVDVVRQALLPARPDRTPVPVPERSGEPSVFEHVIYIIRENRTYDQVLGDMPEGKGDASLCIFGEKVTPNIHQLARDFVLLDNTYCSGILSADGHNWSLSAFANDYLERSFAGWPRSYPDGLGEGDIDVMAWAPTGFLWSAAAKAGRTVRVYGEMCTGEIKWTDPSKPGRPKFTDFLSDHRTGSKSASFQVEPAHASVAPYLARDYPAWAPEIPDVTRTAIFLDHMRACERDGKPWENLHILALPNDHTVGTKPGMPTPASTVADNDLALGQLVEAVSKSSFWKTTCIVTIEDDPQAGWDHVSGYRTVCLVASPYTKRGKVISTHYNQPGLIRTIGLILGFPPLNQMDAGSTPLRDCFTGEPDFTPYQSVPNQTPLEQLNPIASTIQDPAQRAFAEASDRLPLDRVDACDEDELNRILWHAMRGVEVEYPRWAVVPPDQRGEKDDDD